jgi:hypothetical protein
MTPRGFLNFFRSPTGAVLLFLLLLLISYIVAIGFKTPGSGNPSPKGGGASEASDTNPQIVQTITRAMSAFNPPKETPPPSVVVPTVEPKKETAPPALAPISLYAASANERTPESLGDDYAPYGRLIPCELVITVDSSTIDTPIVGLVTDDVWNDGRLIIPAGTEVHGTAQVDHTRERIASSGNWTLVWQTGEELNVTGLALDRDAEDDGWGITDGSAGLRGEMLKTDDFAEIKLFVATFLSGAANGLLQTQQTVFGTQTVGSFQNAPFTGAQAVLNAYAQQILDTIERDGFYVRVPAGKQFYLYVTQTIDKSKAVIGGTRLALKTTEEPMTEDDSLAPPPANLFRLSPPNGRQQNATSVQTAPIIPTQPTIH